MKGPENKLNRKTITKTRYKQLENQTSSKSGVNLFDRYINRYGSRHFKEVCDDKVIEIVKNYKPRSVLEVGCGFGTFLARLSKLVEQVVGIDIAEENVKIAKSKVCRNLSNRKIFVGDAEELKVKGEKFDLVVMKGMIHHLRDPRKAMKEAYELLRENGKIVIFEGDPTAMYRRLILGIADVLKIKHETSLFRHLAPGEISKLLEEERFKIEVCSKISMPFAPFGLVGFGNRITWKIFSVVDSLLKIVPIFNWYVVIVGVK